jgi:hypothetical protein
MVRSAHPQLLKPEPVAAPGGTAQAMPFPFLASPCSNSRTRYSPFSLLLACGSLSRLLRAWSAEPGQERIEGRHFKWHFLRGRSQRDRLGLDQFELIAPGINLDAAAERKSGDLVGPPGVKLRGIGHQG